MLTIFVRGWLRSLESWRKWDHQQKVLSLCDGCCGNVDSGSSRTPLKTWTRHKWPNETNTVQEDVINCT
jgi:hypothetical protein